MQKLLSTLGLVLFLLGLLTGFAAPALKNPRMALSSHLEAVLNGMFLVLLGLLWPHSSCGFCRLLERSRCVETETPPALT